VETDTSGSEAFPDDGGPERAEWSLSYDDDDAYERSAHGSLKLEGKSGRLVVRARYRMDTDRLGEGVVREERGFWGGDDDPDTGDVPFETRVTTWEAEGVEGAEEFLRVCETALTLDLVSLYSEHEDEI
jgi:hypothetical protein